MIGLTFDPFWMFKRPTPRGESARNKEASPSPMLAVNYAGNAAVEDHIVTDVASYGRQLGWLSEIVLALAKGEPAPEESLGQLRKAADAIERIKAEAQVSATEAATQALDRLQSEQPQEYERFLRSRRAP